MSTGTHPSVPPPPTTVRVPTMDTNRGTDVAPGAAYRTINASEFIAAHQRLRGLLASSVGSVFPESSASQQKSQPTSSSAGADTDEANSPLARRVESGMGSPAELGGAIKTITAASQDAIGTLRSRIGSDGRAPVVPVGSATPRTGDNASLYGSSQTHGVQLSAQGSLIQQSIASSMLRSDPDLMSDASTSGYTDGGRPSRTLRQSTEPARLGEGTTASERAAIVEATGTTTRPHLPALGSHGEAGDRAKTPVNPRALTPCPMASAPAKAGSATIGSELGGRDRSLSPATPRASGTPYTGETPEAHDTHRPTARQGKRIAVEQSAHSARAIRKARGPPSRVTSARTPGRGADKAQQSHTSARGVRASQTLRPGEARKGQKYKNWRRGVRIGFGGCGIVYTAIDRDKGHMMAVKQLRVSDPIRKETMRNEVRALRQLNHPNIVRYYGSEFYKKSHITIMLEYVPFDCATLASQYGGLGLHLARKYLAQILEGLIYLHEHNFAHCDIKCANVLMTSEGVPKLSDFGSTKWAGSTTTGRGMRSILWSAPEAVRQNLTGVEDLKRADIWSIGCTFIEMLTGKPPYGDMDRMEQAVFIVAMSSNSPPLPEDVTRTWRQRELRDVKDFLSLCFKADPTERPDARGLLNHRLLAKHRGKNQAEAKDSRTASERQRSDPSSESLTKAMTWTDSNPALEKTSRAAREPTPESAGARLPAVSPEATWRPPAEGARIRSRRATDRDRSSTRYPGAAPRTVSEDLTAAAAGSNAASFKPVESAADALGTRSSELLVRTASGQAADDSTVPVDRGTPAASTHDMADACGNTSSTLEAHRRPLARSGSRTARQLPSDPSAMALTGTPAPSRSDRISSTLSSHAAAAPLCSPGTPNPGPSSAGSRNVVAWRGPRRQRHHRAESGTVSAESAWTDAGVEPLSPGAQQFRSATLSQLGSESVAGSVGGSYAASVVGSYAASVEGSYTGSVAGSEVRRVQRNNYASDTSDDEIIVVPGAHARPGDRGSSLPASDRRSASGTAAPFEAFPYAGGGASTTESATAPAVVSASASGSAQVSTIPASPGERLGSMSGDATQHPTSASAILSAGESAGAAPEWEQESSASSSATARNGIDGTSGVISRSIVPGLQTALLQTRVRDASGVGAATGSDIAGDGRRGSTGSLTTSGQRKRGVSDGDERSKGRPEAMSVATAGSVATPGNVPAPFTRPLHPGSKGTSWDRPLADSDSESGKNGGEPDWFALFSEVQTEQAAWMQTRGGESAGSSAVSSSQKAVSSAEPGGGTESDRAATRKRGSATDGSRDDADCDGCGISPSSRATPPSDGVDSSAGAGSHGHQLNDPSRRGVRDGMESLTAPGTESTPQLGPMGARFIVRSHSTDPRTNATDCSDVSGDGGSREASEGLSALDTAVRRTGPETRSGVLAAECGQISAEHARTLRSEESESQHTRASSVAFPRGRLDTTSQYARPGPPGRGESRESTQTPVSEHSSVGNVSESLRPSNEPNGRAGPVMRALMAGRSGAENVSTSASSASQLGAGPGADAVSGRWGPNAWRGGLDGSVEELAEEDDEDGTDGGDARDRSQGRFRSQNGIGHMDRKGLEAAGTKDIVLPPQVIPRHSSGQSTEPRRTGPPRPSRMLDSAGGVLSGVHSFGGGLQSLGGGSSGTSLEAEGRETTGETLPDLGPGRRLSAMLSSQYPSGRAEGGRASVGTELRHSVSDAASFSQQATSEAYRVNYGDNTKLDMVHIARPSKGARQGHELLHAPSDTSWDGEVSATTRGEANMDDTDGSRDMDTGDMEMTSGTRSTREKEDEAPPGIEDGSSIVREDNSRGVHRGSLQGPPSRVTRLELHERSGPGGASASSTPRNSRGGSTIGGIFSSLRWRTRRSAK